MPEPTTLADALAELAALEDPKSAQLAQVDAVIVTSFGVHGIHHPQLRPRAIDIGERLQVLADYPTSPGCTSPFAPTWITEMVRRQT